MSLELVVRVSSADAIPAAVQTGAAAVCLYAPDCGSRDCFSLSELQEAFKYCRLRGVRAYVYFGSLCTDSDLLRLKELVQVINTAGADGVVAGDLGLIRMIRMLAPQLPIHGSEQLAVHDLAGALAAQKLGLARVTLARELSAEQMRFICDRIDIETQAFCHGEQCVAYSGQCYMSTAVASRSATKGQCMHPCRMAYSYFGDSPGEHLSLKDICLANHIGELDRAGVTAAVVDCFGKRAEYVALHTALYSGCVKTDLPPMRSDLMRLESLFARDGFSDSYIKGEKGVQMFGMRNPAPDREAKAAFAEARKMYQGEGEKPLVPVDMFFSAKAGEEMTLTCRDRDGNEYTSRSPAALSGKKASSKAEIRMLLKRTDKTVFYAELCQVDMDEGLRITPAAISAMRRSCLEGLALRRKQPQERQSGNWQPGLKRLSHRGEPGICLSFLKTDQITPEILDLGPETVCLPIWRMHEDTKIIELLLKRGITPCAVLDRVISDKQWPEVLVALRDLKQAGLEQVLCTSLGQPALLAPLGFTLRGDFGMNILNSQSIKEVKALGLASCTLSFEQSFAQIKELSMGMDCEVIVYGRLPLMLTENCIIHKHHGVHTCHNGSMALIDKTGRSYPLLAEKGCRNTLYNAEKLWLADKTEDYLRLGCRSVRLCFTTENSKECLKVLQAYLGKAEMTPERATRGMYYRSNN